MKFSSLLSLKLGLLPLLDFAQREIDKWWVLLGDCVEDLRKSKLDNLLDVVLLLEDVTEVDKGEGE